MTKSLDEYIENELIEEINSLKKQKKYGLVWEDKLEKVAKDCEGMLPVVKEVPEKTIHEDDNSKPTNIIIEGDNYHALSVLNYTHAEKIDVIYIDPPYNTGNKDFVYNDSFVDKEDSFRHSKWLSFMRKRLILAYELLKTNGVIFISIDDNEYANLNLMCQDIFGEDNIETIIWHKVADDSGRLKITHRVRREHEYILVCYKNIKDTFFKKYLSDRNYKNTYTNPDNDPRGPYKQGIISTTEAKSNKNGKNYYSVTTPSGKQYSRQWRVSKDEFEKLDSDGRIYYGKKGNSVPSLKVFINEKKETTPTTLFLDLGTAKTAGKELRNILNKELKERFPIKPSELIYRIVQISSNKNDTILDFFAGSGTTGQAVLELNQNDNGSRSFILCTNNEANGKVEAGRDGVAQKVLYPRIKTVITGIRGDGTKYSDGIPANVRYFKTDFVEKGDSTDETREKIVARATDIIRIKEGTFDTVLDNQSLKLYSNGNVLTAIIFDPFNMANLWEDIEKNNPNKHKTNLYIFSYSSDVSAFTDEIPSDTKINWTSKPIPDGILKVYKKLFK